MPRPRKPYIKHGVQLPPDAPPLLLELAEYLGGRELAIINARIGLSTGQRMTLEQVATTLFSGITRERVRQLQAKALSLLPGELRATVKPLLHYHHDAMVARKAKKQHDTLARKLKRYFKTNDLACIKLSRIAKRFGFEAPDLEGMPACIWLWEHYQIRFFGPFIRCTFCKAIKPADEFLPSSLVPDQPQNRICRLCNAKRMKAYLDSSPERRALATQRSLERIKRTGGIDQKNWRLRNPEKVREKSMRSYYAIKERDPERLQAYASKAHAKSKLRDRLERTAISEMIAEGCPNHWPL